MKTQELFSRYTEGYDLLINQIQQIPPEAIHFKPHPEEWSISEIIVHLADSEVCGFFRAKIIIAENGSEVTICDRRVWAETLHYDRMNYLDALELIKLLRKNLNQLLSLIDDKTWSNYIYDPESGKVTLRDWIQICVDHIDIHAQQIRQTFHNWRQVNEKELV